MITSGNASRVFCVPAPCTRVNYFFSYLVWPTELQSGIYFDTHTLLHSASAFEKTDLFGLLLLVLSLKSFGVRWKLLTLFLQGVQHHTAGVVSIRTFANFDRKSPFISEAVRPHSYYGSLKVIGSRSIRVRSNNHERQVGREGPNFSGSSYYTLWPIDQIRHGNNTCVGVFLRGQKRPSQGGGTPTSSKYFGASSIRPHDMTDT